MKKYTYTIGLIIGMFIGGKLLIKLDKNLSQNTNADKYVNSYIKNSSKIGMYLTSFFNEKENCSFKNIDEGLRQASFVFFSQEYKKYFAIQSYYLVNIGFELGMTSKKFSDSILATVNNYEMSEPSFGTKEKPIAVLKIDVLSKDSILISGTDSMKINISNEQYVYNVRKYLTYTMSHKDFRKMFPDK